MKNIAVKFALFLVLILATFLRFYHISQISLWHDEAFTATLINYPWRQIFYHIGLDVHPPLYYVLLKFWAEIFGHSITALRGFSAVFSAAAVGMIYLVVRQAFKNNGLALIAALFLAVHPFQLQYAGQIRMYSFGTFIILLSAYLLLKALDVERAYNAGNSRAHAKLIRTWLYFALATSAAMYTHYYEFFSIFALALYALYAEIRIHGKEIRKYKYAAGSYLLVIFLFLPWVKTFIYQFAEVQSNFWIGKPDRWSIPHVLWTMLSGAEVDTSRLAMEILVVIGVLFTIGILAWIAKQNKGLEHEQPKWMVISGLVVPFVLAIILSFKQSIFLERYFIFAALFYTMAITVWIWTFRSKTVRAVLCMIIFTVLCWGNYINTKNVDAENKPGMAAAAGFVNGHAESTDAVIVDSPYEYFNFSYYNHTGSMPLLYTNGMPYEKLPRYSGTAILNSNQVSPKFNDRNFYPSGKIVWLIWTNAYNGYGPTDPNVPSNWNLGPEGKHSWEDVQPYAGTTIYVAEYIVN